MWFFIQILNQFNSQANIIDIVSLLIQGTHIFQKS